MGFSFRVSEGVNPLITVVRMCSVLLVTKLISFGARGKSDKTKMTGRVGKRGNGSGFFFIMM